MKKHRLTFDATCNQSSSHPCETWLAWIWSIDSFCGRCSAVWEGWYMGWEAVYPSLVEETKGTWQNKPQSPQKSADAHTQFCNKYQRTLEWMVLFSLWASRSSNHYKLCFNHQHSNMTQLQAQTQVDKAWILHFTSSALTERAQGKVQPAEQSSLH